MLFFHNSYGTPKFPDCGNLVGADWMENLRWGDTEPSMHFRETNTDPSMYFRKANMDPSLYFRKANTEFVALSFTLNFIYNITSKFTSVFTPDLNPNITTILLHHDKCNIIYFVHSFLFCSKVSTL